MLCVDPKRKKRRKLTWKEKGHNTWYKKSCSSHKKIHVLGRKETQPHSHYGEKEKRLAHGDENEQHW